MNERGEVVFNKKQSPLTKKWQLCSFFLTDLFQLQCYDCYSTVYSKNHTWLKVSSVNEYLLLVTVLLAVIGRKRQLETQHSCQQVTAASSRNVNVGRVGVGGEALESTG